MIPGIGKRSRAVGLFAVTMLMAAALCLGRTPAVAADNFLANFGDSAAERFHGVKATPDGGYAVTGQAGNYIMAAKINTYGNLEWRHVFDDVLGSNCNDIDVDADGFIYITGYVNKVAGEHPKSLWVAKLAPWGAVVWEKIVTDGTNSTRGVYIAASGDGGCAVSSQYRSAEDSNDWTVFRVASDGTLAWARRYGSPEFDMWCRISPVRDPATGDPDGYLLYEFNRPMGSSVDASDLVLIRIDGDGDLLWSNNYAGYADVTHTSPENDFALDAVQTANGGFAVLGRSYNFTDPAWENARRIAYLLKVDNTGGLLWSRRFHHNDGSGHDMGSGSLCEAANGDVVVAGQDYNGHAWLLRFDAGGILLDEKVYDNNGKDYVYGVDATSDNGAVAVGRSNSFGAGDYDGWMIKFDQDLAVGDGCTGVDPNSEIAIAEFVVGVATPHAVEMTGFAAVDYLSPVSDPGFFVGYAWAPDHDSDEDGVFDHEDNAPLTANADQTDTDGDGIGNACDCDLDNNGTVNYGDFMQFRGVWGTSDESADFNADGLINQFDFMILRGRWETSYPWY